MKEYIFELSKNSLTGYFSDKLTGVKVKIFRSKIKGLKIISRMMKDKIVDNLNVLDLIESLVTSPLPEIRNNDIDPLEATIQRISLAQIIFDRIRDDIILKGGIVPRFEDITFCEFDFSGSISFN